MQFDNNCWEQMVVTREMPINEYKNQKEIQFCILKILNNQMQVNCNNLDRMSWWTGSLYTAKKNE